MTAAMRRAAVAVLELPNPSVTIYSILARFPFQWVCPTR